MDDRLAKGIDRRKFLKMLGITSGVLFIPGAVACGGSDNESTTTSSGGGSSTATTGGGTTGGGTTGGGSSTGSVASPAAAGSPASGASSTAGIPFYNGTFTAAMLQNPQGLDPQQNTNTESFQAMLGVFEQLIDYDPISDKFYPQLIEEMPDLSNPTEYTFKLRKGVKFHDGSELTAEDVKATFDFVIQMGGKSPAYSLYNPLDTVTVVDPYTVTMKLKVANSMFIPFLASVMGGIVKKGARDKQDLTRDPSGAGSGPFKFVEWVSGDHLTFERFEGYFRPGYPKFQKLIYRVIVDDSARQAQLLSGALDLNGFVSAKDFDQVTKTKGIQGERGSQGTKVDYIQINHLHEFGKDVHIRRAMAFALDNEALTKSTLYGMGTPAHGPTRPGTKWYDPAVEQLHKFDLEKAKAELSQSSQPNGFTFDLLCENNPYIVQQATLVQAMLAKVNIKANVMPMEKVAYTTAIKLGDPSWFAGVSNWTSSVDTPDYMIKLVYTTKGSYQRSSYSNPTLDKLVDDIEGTSDEAKQKELMIQVQKIMAEDMPAVWFAWEDWLPAWRDYVKGYKPATTYYMYFDEVAIAPH